MDADKIYDKSDRGCKLGQKMVYDEETHTLLVASPNCAYQKGEDYGELAGKVTLFNLQETYEE